MHRWPVEWMSSEAARQHVSIKLSRLAGIEISSKCNSQQPASASFVIFVASMFNSVCREHHILTELYLAGDESEALRTTDRVRVMSVTRPSDTDT